MKLALALFYIMVVISSIVTVIATIGMCAEFTRPNAMPVDRILASAFWFIASLFLLRSVIRADQVRAIVKGLE